MGAATAKRRHIPRRTPYRRPTPIRMPGLQAQARAPGFQAQAQAPGFQTQANRPKLARCHPAITAVSTLRPARCPQRTPSSPQLGLAQARPSPRLDPAPSLIQSPARSSFQRHLQRAILRLSILYHSRVIKYQLISKEEEGVRRAECKLPSRVRQNMGVFRVSRRSSHPIRPSLPGKTYRSILKREFFPHVDD